MFMSKFRYYMLLCVFIISMLWCIYNGVRSMGTVVYNDNEGFRILKRSDVYYCSMQINGEYYSCKFMDEYGEPLKEFNFDSAVYTGDYHKIFCTLEEGENYRLVYAVDTGVKYIIYCGDKPCIISLRGV